MQMALPTRLQKLTELWRLTDITPLPCGPNVFKAYQPEQAREVVLKLARTPKEFYQETLTLKHYQGYASVLLFAENETWLGLLMEYVSPGITLRNLFPDRDAEAVKIAASLMQRLAQCPLPQPQDFPKLATWLEVFKHERNRVLPQHLLERADALGRELLQSTTQEVLLHADLHHQNILSSDRCGYIAIDPHGVVGDPAFEVAAFMRNPVPEIFNSKALAKTLHTRLALFAELLAIEQERLHAWSFVGAMLSAAWAVEDGHNFLSVLTIAELLSADTI